MEALLWCVWYSRIDKPWICNKRSDDTMDHASQYNTLIIVMLSELSASTEEKVTEESVVVTQAQRQIPKP